MATYQSQRPVKPEENHHRPLGTNLIGTLTIGNPAQPAVWTPGPNENPLFTLGQALAAHVANGDLPLLWAFSSTNAGYEFKFGYDVQVASVAVGALPGAQVKIGHVALTNTATISGEIIQAAGGGWEIDNNSGAWGSMANNDGKSTMMATAAQLISARDPGGIVVNARRAYSRRGWKRKIQQVFR